MFLMDPKIWTLSTVPVDKSAMLSLGMWVWGTVRCVCIRSSR